MKTISRILIFAMLNLCWLTSYSFAETLATETAAKSNIDRQRLFDLMNRQGVIDELETYGISKVEAVARINSLTEEEVAEITGKLETLPEGGYAALGYAAVLALMLAVVALKYTPAIISATFYTAFTPFAAGACIFMNDPWKVCMGNYWGHFVKGYNGIYGSDNEDEQGFGYDSSDESIDCDPGMESCT